MFELLGDHDDRRGRASTCSRSTSGSRLLDDPDRNLLHLRASLPDAGPRLDPPDAGRGRRPRRRGGRVRARRCRSGSTSSTSASGPTATPPRSFPATRCSTSTDRRVALTGGEYQGRRRMTLTYPAIDAARRGPLAGHRRRQARPAREAPRSATRRSPPAGSAPPTRPSSAEAALLAGLRRPARAGGRCARPRSPRATMMSEVRLGSKRPWSTTPGWAREPAREPGDAGDLAACSRRSRRRRGTAARPREARPSPSSRIVAARPNRLSSSGIGRADLGDRLRASRR